MPINKKILDALLEEVTLLEDIDKDKNKPRDNAISLKTGKAKKYESLKKKYLVSTEKKLYFYISNHYKLTMLSIDDPGVALEIWLKGILPLLLQQHGLNIEEWERICDIGDSDKTVKALIHEEWVYFYKNIIKKGRIDDKIIRYINEGKLKVERLRSTNNSH